MTRPPIHERFPGDEHRQIYYMWREYPLGSKITFCCGFIVGFLPLLLLLAFRVIP